MALNLLLDYSSSESEAEMEFERPQPPRRKRPEKKEENVDEEVRKVLRNIVNKIEKRYEFRSFSSSESETDDDDVDDIASMYSYDYNLDFDEEDLDEEECIDLRRQKRCLTKGELGIEDLPKIEQLHITVPKQKLTQIGTIQTIIHPLVIVQTFRNSPPLDLDSILFTNEGTALGQIFDVMGQVQQPMYVLRFNDPSEIESAGLVLGTPIYFVEHEAPLTKYVFVRDLLKEKGCDASWKHNNEVPPEEKDFSDDDQERSVKSKGRKRRNSSRRPNFPNNNHNGNIRQ